MHGVTLHMEDTWRGVRQHPIKGSLVFVGVKTPLKV